MLSRDARIKNKSAELSCDKEDVAEQRYFWLEWPYLYRKKDLPDITLPTHVIVHLKYDTLESKVKIYGKAHE